MQGMASHAGMRREAMLEICCVARSAGLLSAQTLHMRRLSEAQYVAVESEHFHTYCAKANAYQSPATACFGTDDMSIH